MRGAYLCAARALVFEGSVLAYNPARDEVEWVLAHGVTNGLSWAEERSAVALANYVPCIPQEVDFIAKLGAYSLVVGPTIPPQRKRTMSRQRKKMVSRRGMNTRRQRDTQKQTPNCVQRHGAQSR